MKQEFGQLKNGKTASLYRISHGGITARISDLGATLVALYVPDRDGTLADVVLGFDDPNAYVESGTFFGAVVGRNANRIKGAAFALNGAICKLDQNENKNNLHSGPDFYKDRLWRVVRQDKNSICLELESPNGDQGFPGKAVIRVTYTLTAARELRIDYDAICDQDTVFNLTNHTYFNLAGHDRPELAMTQELMLPARVFCPADDQSIPTGELVDVAGTPMDFRTPTAIGDRIGEDYPALKLQHGYDHNYEVYTAPCAILRDPASGRTMAVTTDLPGVQLYSGNFVEEAQGKGGVAYPRRSGICLETQYYPNSLNEPQWKKPITPAGQRWRSTTVFRFQ